MIAKSRGMHAVEEVEGSGAPLDSASFLFRMKTAAEDSGETEIPLRAYLDSRRALGYQAVYSPLGYPLRVLSNSPRVLEAAAQSWDSFPPLFHGQPLEVLVGVRTGAGSNFTLPPAPTHKLDGSMLHVVADADNFFVADLKNGRAMARVTPMTAQYSRYLRYFFLEAAALSMISSIRGLPVHAACVRVNGKGVLLCADSGEGKSTLAYAGARSGWTYISDDSTYIPLDREDRLAVGNFHQIRFRPSGVELFPELRGRPITPRAAGKPSIEVRTSDWPGIATAHSTIVDHVVFLNRKCADTQELIPLRNAAVRPWFMQHVIAPPETRWRHLATIARLLAGGVHELRYRDLVWAIERMHHLVETGN